MKEAICQLTMQWSKNFENFRDEELEAKALDFLRPHQNLENLEISYYGGLEFASWLGSPSYVNMVHLRLHRCCRAKILPPLGRLTSLKDLYIEGPNAICRVGSEFYGVENPFPSLIILEFRNMPLWEDWSHCVGTQEIEVVFPRLEHLVIRDCPLLIGRLPKQLISLVKLDIHSCPSMDASPSIISLPSLNKLNFRGCNERVLKTLANLTSLTTLALSDVAELTCFNHGFTSSLIKLEELEMYGCKRLMYLWQDRDATQNLACLEHLSIDSCPEFIYFVAGEADIVLPGNLKTIELINCFNLGKLPSKMHTLSSLRDLRVSKCPRLVSFPKTGIPTSLTSLRIEKCEMLQSLPEGLGIHLNEPSNSNHTHGDMTFCLQELEIYGCDSLPASPFGEGRFLPTTLKSLKIKSCGGMESLPEINLEPLQSLQEILIVDCENLRSLPQGLHTLSHLTNLRLEDCPALELQCFPPLPLGISSFRLRRCPKIKSLPNQLHRLSCLRDLEISWCESITRFPDGGLPPQLQRLGVSDCGNMKQPVGDWLAPLTSLEVLSIYGDVGGVGEEEDLLLPLPSSLQLLAIRDMGNVKRLSSSLPPSLRTLRIWNCPKLRELPQDGLPPSLEALQIIRCEILKERCSKRACIETLGIKGCGILKERCPKRPGCYWHLIREIPDVSIF